MKQDNCWARTRWGQDCKHILTGILLRVYMGIMMQTRRKKTIYSWWANGWNSNARSFYSLSSSLLKFCLHRCDFCVRFKPVPYFKSPCQLTVSCFKCRCCRHWFTVLNNLLIRPLSLSPLLGILKAAVDFVQLCWVSYICKLGNWLETSSWSK